MDGRMDGGEKEGRKEGVRKEGRREGRNKQRNERRNIKQECKYKPAVSAVTGASMSVDAVTVSAGFSATGLVLSCPSDKFSFSAIIIALKSP